jgi:hypothetical protein
MVPRTILELRRRGWAEAAIQELVWNNPRDYYAQSGRLRPPTLDRDVPEAAAPEAVGTPRRS